jgi:hypothetical protein
MSLLVGHKGWKFAGTLAVTVATSIAVNRFSADSLGIVQGITGGVVFAFGVFVNWKKIYRCIKVIPYAGPARTT